MVPRHPAQALAELAQALQSAHETEPTADAVIDRALELVHDADWVSLTVRRRGSYVTLASTAPEAQLADELQYALGEGPCVDASHAAEWYRSGSVALDARWPRWGPRAAELGIRSLLSVQLSTEDRAIGAINIYSRRDGGFADRDEVDFAVLYGAHAAIALTSAREITGLRSALQTRHAIGVAQGMLMERYGLDLDTSFDLLRRYSSQLNVKLVDVATDIVTSGKLPRVEEEDLPADATNGSSVAVREHEE